MQPERSYPVASVYVPNSINVPWASMSKSRIRLQIYSYRFAEQVLNSKLALKQEVEAVLLNPEIKLDDLSRPKFNEVLDRLFTDKGWQSQPGLPFEKVVKYLPHFKSAIQVPIYVIGLDI
jgi:hypothetical protein